MLCPKAIATASGKTIEEVKNHFQKEFALYIDDDGYTGANPPEAIITFDGKHHFTAETIGIERFFNCNKYDIANNMTAEEICDDIKTFIQRVIDLFQV